MATLTRIFGSEHLNLAEDVVQVALADVHGPQAGIEAVGAIRNLQSLESYYLLYAVLSEFESRLHHSQAAAAHLRKCLQLAEIRSEQAFLSKRLQACEKLIRT